MKSSPKLSVEPIKWLSDVRSGRKELEAQRDAELTAVNVKWDAEIQNYLNLKVTKVRAVCPHLHVLRILDDSFARFYGDTRNPVFAGYYCAHCGQYSSVKPESSLTEALAEPEDIYTLYGLNQIG